MNPPIFMRLVKIAVVALVVCTALQGAFPTRILSLEAGPALAQAAAAPASASVDEAPASTPLADAPPALQAVVLLLCGLFVVMAVFPLFVDIER